MYSTLSLDYSDPVNGVNIQLNIESSLCDDKLI